MQNDKKWKITFILKVQNMSWAILKIILVSFKNNQFELFYKLSQKFWEISIFTFMLRAR